VPGEPVATVLQIGEKSGGIERKTDDKGQEKRGEGNGGLAAK